MKCKSIQVKRLFNTFDYQLSWSEDSEHILLLTGPNGYGKTTLLKILYYLKEGQWYYFYKLPFSEIQIEFDNNTQLCMSNVIEKSSLQNNINDEVVTPIRSLRLQLKNNNKLSSEFLFTEADAKRIEAGSPHKRIAYIDHFEEKCTLQETLDYIEENAHVYEFLNEKEGYGAIRMFVEALNVHFIPANRLVSREKGSNVLLVQSISDQIKARLRRTNYRYLNRVSEARSHVFENLLKGSKEYSRDDYNRITSELSEKVKTMHKWGLIPFKEFIPYQDGKGDIFYVYLNEIKDTLALYEDLYLKLETFASLLGKKNFINKVIEYSPNRGLLVLSSTGEPIDIDCLSSGEQNEIVLLYAFIFQLSPNMILLIDEPENSLHVEWQSVFYEELQEICKANNIQAIVATHSPQIIGERWESCFDLFEQTE